MRGAEDATDQFLAALTEASILEQLTVEVSQQVELDDRGGTRGGGGGEEIVLDVPAPGDGNGQVLLYAAEDGSLSWHLSDSVAPSQTPTRGGERRTYRLPRQVVVAQSSEGGQRGVLGAVGTKLFKVLVFPLIDPVLGAVGEYFAARWEQHHRRNQVRWLGVDSLATRDVPAFGEADWARLREGVSLLFLHGTTAMSHTAFTALPADVLGQLAGRYGGRVLALDHYTISVTPRANVAWLAGALPATGAATVDVVTHSRGGLVGRALAERAVELGIGDRLTVRNLVMVAPPNAGTALADKEHLSRLLDRITNLVQYIPDNGVTDALGLVLSIVKQVAVGAFGGLDGIMSMDPHGSDLTAFNDSPGSRATYRVVASDFEPPAGSSLGRIARDQGTDFVFGAAPNDLVVPTLGAYQLPSTPGFPVADPLVFPAEAGVDHSSYFGRSELAAKLLDWLPGE
jgi:pimeloyl-ACP methyl ester carboxylesterase